MLKRYRYLILAKGLIPLAYHLIRLYSRTFSLSVENEAAWRQHFQAGGKVILCTWHQQFFAAMRPFRAYAPAGPSLMISRSRDGDIISYVAERHGWRTVRGSSSRGGKSALKEMIARVRQSRLAGHVVDGPKGPAGIVKAGVIRLAHATGAVIVPFYVSADRAWHFRSWDSFLLPKPFARVHLRFGDIVRLETPAGEEDFETQRAALEAIMRPGLIAG
jgi:hypothetical protein